MTTKFPTPNLDALYRDSDEKVWFKDAVKEAQADISLAVEAARVEVPEDVRKTLEAVLKSDSVWFGLVETDELIKARRWLESLRPAKASEPKPTKRNWKAEVAAIAHALGIEYVPDEGGAWPGELEPMLNRIRDLYDIEDAWAAHSMGELEPGKASEPEQFPRTVALIDTDGGLTVSFNRIVAEYRDKPSERVCVSLDSGSTWRTFYPKSEEKASEPVEKRCGTCLHFNKKTMFGPRCEGPMPSVLSVDEVQLMCSENEGKGCQVWEERKDV